MDIKLLKKFAANKCSPDEVDAVFNWVQEQPDKITGENLLKNYWKELEVTELPDNETALWRLYKIHHTINLNQSERLTENKIRSLLTKKFSPVRMLYRAAAILLIPVITLLVYTYVFQPELYSALNISQKYEIVSPPDSRTHFELPDGTKVWLNDESKMVYPQRFIGKTRTVQLIGEAYFEVSPDKSKPFIVETQGIAVKAVGTCFNIKAYHGDPDIETTLESGKVIILKDTGKKSEICEMEPGQHFVFNRTTNKYSLKREDPAKYVSWREGKLIFQDDRLDQVAQRLSRWYNIQVKLKDPELSSLTYTATFVDETVYQILEMLEIVTPISYTVTERQKLPDGTFSEKVILIHKKKER
ncbi:MAG: FecR domain-containing protein [Prolixibacteraceae bacterium]|jgi:ferric-dicitrate binding protein FerR (iron transport regulator)